MRILIFLTVLSIFLTACSEDEQHATDTLLLEQQQEHLLSTYSQAHDTRWMFHDLTAEYSSEESRIIGNWYLKRISEIDSICLLVLKYTDEIKLDILHEINPVYGKKTGPRRVVKYHLGEESGLLPTMINFSKIHSKASYNLGQHKYQLKQLLVKTRGSFSRYISMGIWMKREQAKRFGVFKDPKILNFRNKEILIKKLRKIVSAQKLTPDCKESVIQLYIHLSLNDKEFDALFRTEMTWQSAMQTVLNLEQKIMQAWLDIGRMYNSHFCYSDFPFDKVVSVVQTKNEDIHAGDTITCDVFLAGIYNTFRKPEVECNRGSVIKTENGMATIKVVVPKKGNFTLNGTITVFNNSGVPKAFPWKRTFYAH